jgi:hypothetical protein
MIKLLQLITKYVYYTRLRVLNYLLGRQLKRLQKEHGNGKTNVIDITNKLRKG